MIFPNATSDSTYDYNGYRPNRGVSEQYLWSSPSPESAPTKLRGFKTLHPRRAPSITPRTWTSG